MRPKLLFAAFFTTLALSAQAQQLPYQDKKLSPAERAEDLLQRLTLDEKLGLMEHTSKAVERLGIKPYTWWNETLHGVGRNGLATVFPQCIGLAATFNNDLVYHVFDAASDEARAKHYKASQEGDYSIYKGLTFWTPNINIFRDPRWGRGQETYGEDPYLTELMGLAVVHGLQGDARDGVDKLHACAKHFAVHSGPEWNRHSFDVEKIDPRDLWETYLPAFKALVQKGNVKEVMCAYNRVDGQPCCGNNRLLNQILRNEWGFQGVVTSDCWAVSDFFQKGHHETHADAASASAAAVLSGTDIECGNVYTKNLAIAVERGEINASDIDVSVRRLLTARFELGEMDETSPWDDIPYSVVSSDEHQQLNLKAALESIVLLQNKNNILPLSPKMKVAVIGANANDSVMLWGNYNGIPDHTYTILDGVKQYAKKVVYDPACDLVSTTQFHSLYNQCKSNGKVGFTASYWNGGKQEGEPVAKNISYTTPIQLTADGGISFAAGVERDNVFGSFKTKFTASKNQEVEIQASYTGRVVVIVDGKEVATKGGNSSKKLPVYTLNAQAGKTYDIEVQYSISGYNAQFGLDLGVNEPTDNKALIKKLAGTDVVIYVGGISPMLEGEEMPVSVDGFKGGDRTDIQLPKVQRQLLAELKKAGKKVVFVNCSGSAVGLTPETENCDAIVQLFYAGQQGGKALGQMLYGDYNPAGRLPVTFYKDTLQIPDFEEYGMKGRTYRYMTEKPQFCFGHGLSYTTFSYGDAQVSRDKIVIPVTNTGSRNGDEVVQLYVNRPSDAEGPVKTLRGFKRVNIPAGQTVQVEFPLNDETFTWWDKYTNTMLALSGEFKLLYGGTSDSDFLKTATIIRP